MRKVSYTLAGPGSFSMVHLQLCYSWFGGCVCVCVEAAGPLGMGSKGAGYIRKGKGTLHNCGVPDCQVVVLWRLRCL